MTLLSLTSNETLSGKDQTPARAVCLCLLREIFYYPVWFSPLHLVKGMAR